MATLYEELPIGMSDPVTIYVKQLCGEILCMTVDPFIEDTELARQLFEFNPRKYPLRLMTFSREYEAPREWGLYDEETIGVLIHGCAECEGLLQMQPQTPAEYGVTILHSYEEARYDMIRYCNLLERTWIALEDIATKKCRDQEITIPNGCAVLVGDSEQYIRGIHIGLYYLLRKGEGDSWSRYVLVDNQITYGGFFDALLKNESFICDLRGSGLYLI
jgi:hypothetical protein